MTASSTNHSLELRLLTGRFAIAQLASDAPVPDWVHGEVTCVARTPGELSILCAEDAVPEPVRANRGWRCLEVAGPLDFSEVGILASLTAALGAAGVSVFVFSTFDTDYVLIREEKLSNATKALQSSGHELVCDSD